MAAIRLIPLLLLIAFPLVSHIGALTAHTELNYLFLGVILVSSIVGRPLSGTMSAVGLFGLALIAIGGFLDRPPELPARLLPALVYCSLSLFFARSLLPGSTPIVTRVMQRMRHEPPPRVLAYCRNLTIFWALLLFLLGSESLLMGLYAPAHLWSLMTNFINPGLIMLAFVAEYQVRRFLLKEVEHKGFFRHLQDLARNGLTVRDPRHHARR